MVRQIIINTAVSAMIVIVGLLLYHKNYAVKVYALDLKGFIAAQQQMLIEGKLDNKGIDEHFKILDKKMKEKGENAVILTSDVVIKGDEIEMD
ncbi:MAG: hypothetical protein AMK70_04690 [Nitrospira bacterium SG8_35_1]|nr:MAG: hypothetical protein AMK70_04690 [Nitrospira bacterium SG8_35_1]